MANQYFNSNYKANSLGSTITDGIVWDQDEIQVSLTYPSETAEPLSDNDTFLSTNETNNDTHYFSVLETSNENILEDLNEMPDNETVDNEKESGMSNICTIGGEPDIYRIEGSDDLYAFEVAYDEEGNMQRFRYRLRLNESGEYETVPESIELLPLEQVLEMPEQELETAQSHLHEEIETEEGSICQTVNVHIKQEHDHTLVGASDSEESMQHTLENEDENLPEHDEASGENSDADGEQPDEEEAETKAGILSFTKPETRISCKAEVTYEETYENENVSPLEDNAEEQNFLSENVESEDTEKVAEDSAPEDTELDKSLEETEDIKSSLLESFDENYEIEHEESYDSQDTSESDDSEEEYSNNLKIQNIETLETDDLQNVPFIEEINDNDSDLDEYQIVDGIHVTGDIESQENPSQVLEHILQDPLLQHQILKIQQQPAVQTAVNTKLKEVVNSNIIKKGVTYYIVQQHPEKENVAVSINSKSNNPRSLLKSSFVNYEKKEEKKIEKKIPKTKEEIQVKLLQNFINKTTIVQAPIRQHRLPRKQTIKPVKRADEEIIVQEVVVSSNGFVETTEDGIVKSRVPLKPTAFVQLTDSDDEYNPKKEGRSKKKNKKRRSKVPEIVISDSEDAASSNKVVQIDLSVDSDEEIERSLDQDSKKLEGRSSLVKKRRGRPPKRPAQTKSSDESSASKKQKSDETSDSASSSTNAQKSNKGSETDSSKSEAEHVPITKWKCNKCPKSFPSQGSLKSHMHYHNFHEQKEKSSQPSTSGATDNSKVENTAQTRNTYECSTCKEKFKNRILLTRHMHLHKTVSKNLECNICKKVFTDLGQLNNHKRTHIKEKMFKSTTPPSCAPKLTKRSVGPKLSPKKSFKCDHCSKMYTTQNQLKLHLCTHKLFNCTSCSKNFISKLALESHVRHSCVKVKQLPRRLSLNTRKSLMAPPKKVSKRISLRRSLEKAPVIPSPSTKKNKVLLSCEQCSRKFPTHKALFVHKVQSHGLKTPDKAPAGSKTKTSHSSVPPAERLRKAYDLFKSRRNL